MQRKKKERSKGEQGKKGKGKEEKGKGIGKGSQEDQTKSCHQKNKSK
jgi:hypothetical protein